MKKLPFLSLLFVFICSYLAALDQKPMVIVIPSYKNEKWYALNLNSVVNQNYKNYRILYVNDNSPDETGTLVESYLRDYGIDYRAISFESSSKEIPEIVREFSATVNSESHFFTLVNNKSRAGALANLYRMIHSCQDDEIVITVDGDDWLANDNVLKLLNDHYRSDAVWFTHGTLYEYPYGHVAWCEPVPSNIIEKNAFREFKCPSHLRTFYSWLFKKIRLDDFLYNGDFFPMAWDMAIMFPLAEMAGERHAFVKEVTYVYNMINPINDNRVNAQLQNDLDALIRAKPRYPRLKKI